MKNTIVSSKILIILRPKGHILVNTFAFRNLTAKQFVKITSWNTYYIKPEKRFYLTLYACRMLYHVLQLLMQNSSEYTRKKLCLTRWKLTLNWSLDLKYKCVAFPLQTFLLSKTPIWAVVVRGGVEGTGAQLVNWPVFQLCRSLCFEVTGFL